MVPDSKKWHLEGFGAIGMPWMQLLFRLQTQSLMKEITGLTLYDGQERDVRP